MLAEIEDSEGGSYYIRFLAQVIGRSAAVAVRALEQPPRGGPRAHRGVVARGAAGHCPETLLGQRFGLMWEQVIHALADREQLRESAADMSPAAFVENLIDVVTGGFAAPVGPATLEALGATAASRGGGSRSVAFPLRAQARPLVTGYILPRRGEQGGPGPNPRPFASLPEAARRV